MARLSNTFFLFTIILIEGFIVLSAELLAIRQTLPFVGSGTDTFSIIIAAVLMPLAVGYQSGGQFKLKRKDGSFQSIRKKLLSNILIASAILLPGMSFLILNLFFFGLEEMGIDNALIRLTIYCLIFLVFPVYLLGQTVPLISNYFSKERLSKTTGFMLCFSTLGSFAGSIVTTLVLMQYIGVHHTTSVLFALLTFLVFLLSKKKMQDQSMIMIGLFGICLILNSDAVMNSLHIVKNNKYSTIMIMTLEDENNEIPHLIINNNDSSRYSKDGTKHDYVELAERLTLDSIPADSAPKDVLIIGAGGFTFGHNDEKNNFVYIDIDKDLKVISEKYLLKEELKANKIFYPLPARAYLNSTDKKFDIVLLDAYLGGLSIPEHLVTQEFFQSIKAHIKDNGILVTNFILSSNFNNIFSKSIDDTMRSVFPHVSRQNTEEDYNLWTESKTLSANIMYIYKHDNDVLIEAE